MFANLMYLILGMFTFASPNRSAPEIRTTQPSIHQQPMCHFTGGYNAQPGCSGTIKVGS